MTEPPSREQPPTPRDLDREARRLARVRRLRLVADDKPQLRELDERRLALIPDIDPDPKGRAA